MDRLDIVRSIWVEKNHLTEDLLYKVSGDIRKACYGGVMRGFYGKSTKDLSQIILDKTGIKVNSIKEIIQLGDEYLLSCHTNIERRIYKDLVEKGLKDNPARFRMINNYQSQMYDYGISVGKRAKDYFKIINEHHNIPRTYLIRYLESLKDFHSIPAIKVEFKLDESIYNPDDSIREKLKKVNKKIDTILFSMLYNCSSNVMIVSEIKRQRYESFYGIGLTQQELLKERTTKKSVKQLFDVMDDAELAHHLNISVEILSYLKKNQNKYIKVVDMIEKVRAIAFNEALEVSRKEGIKPSDYQQLYIEAHPISKNEISNQLKLF